jgi:hypothetical protein
MQLIEAILILHRCWNSSGVWEGVGFEEMKSLRHDCVKVELDVAQEDLRWSQ